MLPDANFERCIRTRDRVLTADEGEWGSTDDWENRSSHILTLALFLKLEQCGQLGLQSDNWAIRKSVCLLKKQCWLLPKNWATFYQAPKNWATFHRALQFERMLSDACEDCQNEIHIFEICQN